MTSRRWPGGSSPSRCCAAATAAPTCPGWTRPARLTGRSCWPRITTTPKARRGRAREHVDEHVALADRLWRGDPPELWEAAQRLLDLGEDRHDVLHTLIETIETAGPHERDIAAALAELPPEERG